MPNAAHDAKMVIGHGLDGERAPWTRKISPRAKEKWSEAAGSGHAANDDHGEAANDAKTLPIHETFGKIFDASWLIANESWQNADKPISAEDASIYHLAEIEARRELQRCLDSNAMLTLAPDDYMRLYKQMEEVAHAMVRETRDVASAGKTVVGTHAFREKIKHTVHKYIGNKHGMSHVHCDHAKDNAPKQPTTVATLTHLCGIDLQPPTLHLPHH